MSMTTENRVQKSQKIWRNLTWNTKKLETKILRRTMRNKFLRKKFLIKIQCKNGPNSNSDLEIENDVNNILDSGFDSENGE